MPFYHSFWNSEHLCYFNLRSCVVFCLQYIFSSFLFFSNTILYSVIDMSHLFCQVQFPVPFLFYGLSVEKLANVCESLDPPLLCFSGQISAHFNPSEPFLSGRVESQVSRAVQNTLLCTAYCDTNTAATGGPDLPCKE